MSSAKQRREAIHDSIRDAAVVEFARNGLSGTSTQAIAQAAGITKAQLHYYITSKEDLYQQVLGDIVTRWKEIFFLSTSAPDDPRIVIADYVRRKIRHALHHPEVARFFAREIARGAPEMARHWGPLRQSVDEATAIIQGWIDTGRIRPLDPLLFQMNLWAVTQHYAEYETQVRMLMDRPAPTLLDETRIVEEATALFLGRCGLLD
ncbi:MULTISPECIES: TetR family transcriptional regulator C-terminal domain-containing protein [Paracoccus]|uniref:TetR family transcriptional regulator n=1 Tax=Paracoccus litorisediminis TaxID=2006130 RepID=A0A844HJY2_9RHOB|nr:MULTISPECIES: TetR family transcriptional regulator C-terminal domain-containing protein [Paracoccus]MBD9527102.1 TetR family transcriptional regulator C-terminal domain-containing protein [Paracoccus sp. PAR01]MTH59349.1 TetR family transcriptional regulator [Paracoccus litorisediminis]